MHVRFNVLIMASAFSFISSETKISKTVFIDLTVVRPRLHGQQSTPKNDEGKREKRSVSVTEQSVVTDTINSLRSSVGASDMNYLSFSNSVADIISNWTSYCNFDADISANENIYAVLLASKYPADYESNLTSIFTDSQFLNALRSIELRSIGVGETFCPSAYFEGKNITNYYFVGYGYSFTSYFNENLTQYTLGEECTTCQSGSYWCYEGLCKSDCSTSDSSCYCNSYCLNCANTNQATCTCQCPQGWTGSRCETRGINASTTTCSTTPRMPRVSATTSTTTTPSTTRTTSTPSTTRTAITPSTTRITSTPSTTRAASIPSTTRITSTPSTIRIASTINTQGITSTTSTPSTISTESAAFTAPGPKSSISGSLSGKSMFQLALCATMALLLRL